MKLNDLECIEFPSIEELTNMKENTDYCYVSSYFCVGFMNYLKNLSAFMIARYSIEDCFDNSDTVYLPDNSDELKKYYENIKELETIDETEWCHTRYGEFCIDDVIITGESDNFFYCVWLDRDVSDCCITKVKKEDFETMENFKNAVVDDFKERGYKINEIRKPDGMVRW